MRAEPTGRRRVEPDVPVPELVGADEELRRLGPPLPIGLGVHAVCMPSGIASVASSRDSAGPVPAVDGIHLAFGRCVGGASRVT